METDFEFSFDVHKCFNVSELSYLIAGWMPLSEEILQACKELIDDAKMGCADLVFKELCLEILSRARNVLTERQFKHLLAYATERMKEKIPFELQQQIALNR